MITSPSLYRFNVRQCATEALDRLAKKGASPRSRSSRSRQRSCSPLHAPRFSEPSDAFSTAKFYRGLAEIDLESFPSIEWLSSGDECDTISLDSTETTHSSSGSSVQALSQDSSSAKKRANNFVAAPVTKKLKRSNAFSGRLSELATRPACVSPDSGGPTNVLSAQSKADLFLWSMECPLDDDC